jgi:uncharacterized protein (TIGR04255 family)
MTTTLPKPLGGPPPPEVSLARAPLVKVLAQVRFPDILKIDGKDAIVGLQEKIRGEYPLFEQQPTQQLHFEVGIGDPIIRRVPANLWRFVDAEKNWRVSLTTSLCSLECDHYTSRDDFLSRWDGVLAAIQESFIPQIVLRIGLRYINQVKGAPFENVEELVRPGVLGLATPDMRQYVLHQVTEATLRIEEGEMLLRCGLLPASATVDPGMLIPIPEKSWILDIDVYSSAQRKFSIQELHLSFRALAEREYSVFRFITTERFLQEYGATR